jgi:hypothetical protein
MVQVFPEHLVLEAIKPKKVLSVFKQTAKHRREFSVYQHYGVLKYDAVEFGSFGVTSCFSLQDMRVKTSNLTIFTAPKDDGKKILPKLR